MPQEQIIIDHNWKYYVYKKIHIVQHRKQFSLQFESKTKAGVVKKVNNFANRLTKIKIQDAKAL